MAYPYRSLLSGTEQGLHFDELFGKRAKSHILLPTWRFVYDRVVKNGSTDAMSHGGGNPGSMAAYRTARTTSVFRSDTGFRVSFYFFIFYFLVTQGAV